MLCAHGKSSDIITRILMKRDGHEIPILGFGKILIFTSRTRGFIQSFDIAYRVFCHRNPSIIWK